MNANAADARLTKKMATLMRMTIVVVVIVVTRFMNMTVIVFAFVSKVMHSVINVPSSLKKRNSCPVYSMWPSPVWPVPWLLVKVSKIFVFFF